MSRYWVVQRRLALAAIACFLMVAVGATSDAQGSPAFLDSSGPELSTREMATRYSEQYGDSYGDALTRMELQRRVSGLPEELKASLGSRYAGVWIDPNTGYVEVGELSTAAATDDAAIKQALAKRGLEGVGHAALVKTSLADLERAQYTAWKELEGFVDDGDMRITISEPGDKVLVIMTPKASAEAWSAAREVSSHLGSGQQAYGPPLPPLQPSPMPYSQASNVAPQPAEKVTATVEVESGPELDIKTPSCGTSSCSLPLRAGVEIEGELDYCSAGFVSTWWSGTETVFFVEDAGHCIHYEGSSHYWYAYPYPSTKRQQIGSHWSWRFGNCCGEPSWQNGQVTFDASIINMSYADYWTDELAPGPLWIHGWPTGTEWEIHEEARPYTGEYGCRSGYASTYSCGTVSATDAIISVEGGTGVSNEMEISGACAAHGDSGGPFVNGGIALGLLSAGSNSPCITWYGKTTDIHSWFGVSVYG